MEGERQNHIDRRQFLKGAVEMAVGSVVFLDGFGHLAVQVLKKKGIPTKAGREVPDQGIILRDKVEEGNTDSKNLTYLLKEVVGGPLSAKGIIDIYTARKRDEAASKNGQPDVTQGSNSGIITSGYSDL
jgi:hypothetical protein